MVARRILESSPVTLTSANHPENAQEPEGERQPTVSLASLVGLGALSSVLGMTIGSAALSTAFKSDNGWEVICLIPMVATAAGFMGGWAGAFFHMIRFDHSEKGS